MATLAGSPGQRYIGPALARSPIRERLFLTFGGGIRVEPLPNAGPHRAASRESRRTPPGEHRPASRLRPCGRVTVGSSLPVVGLRFRDDLLRPRAVSLTMWET